MKSPDFGSGWIWQKISKNYMGWNWSHMAKNFTSDK